MRASITHSLLATQLFVAVAALTSLVLAAVTAERSASEEAQRELLAEQAALRKIATLVTGGTHPDRIFEEVTAAAAQTLGAATTSLARFDPRPRPSRSSARGAKPAPSHSPWDRA